MYTWIIFINMFFCPMLAMLILFKRQNKMLAVNLESILIYGTLVAMNMPLTKAFVVIIDKITHKLIDIESTYYTLLALITSFLIPYLYEIIYKSLGVKCTIEKKEKKEEYEEK